MATNTESGDGKFHATGFCCCDHLCYGLAIAWAGGGRLQNTRGSQDCAGVQCSSCCTLSHDNIQGFLCTPVGCQSVHSVSDLRPYSATSRTQGSYSTLARRCVWAGGHPRHHPMPSVCSQRATSAAPRLFHRACNLLCDANYSGRGRFTYSCSARQPR